MGAERPPVPGEVPRGSPDGPSSQVPPVRCPVEGRAGRPSELCVPAVTLPACLLGSGPTLPLVLGQVWDRRGSRCCHLETLFSFQMS